VRKLTDAEQCEEFSKKLKFIFNTFTENDCSILKTAINEGVILSYCIFTNISWALCRFVEVLSHYCLFEMKPLKIKRFTKIYYGLKL
jgi:hypothetical protein